ncbi:MAG: hypothetical protein GX552_13060 [Chloroflexi bacterium]|nr:hypothetical protein [Chloroflexota bacterium]
MTKSGGPRRKFIDNIGTVSLALVLAVVIWVYAMYQNDRPQTAWFPEAIPIEVVNAPSGLEVVNNPAQSARVQIKAFASSWNSLTVDSFRATVDWRNLKEGLHSVPVKVTSSDGTVTIVSTQPESIYVQLEPVRKVPMEVAIEITDRDSIPLGYTIDPPPESEPRFVSVEGPASAVERVTSIVAAVSVGGEREHVERTVEPRALDEKGQVVREVRLSPQTVEISFDIEKKLNYREVAVRALITGQPARGYFVSSVEVHPATVTVSGPPAIVAEMPGLVTTDGEVDTTGATSMLAKRLPLQLPPGVSVLSEDENELQDVLVTVEIDPVVGGATVELPIQTRKIQDGLQAKLSVPSVDVILTGPAVVLDDLQLDLLSAYVDLSGLGVGKHQVKTMVDPMVSQNEELADLTVTSISPAYIEVVITEAPTPTPEPTAASDATSSSGRQPTPTSTAPPLAAPTRTQPTVTTAPGS